MCAFDQLSVKEQEQEAKPEEPELESTEEDTELEEEGTSWLNLILYILGAIAVIAAGAYFFMRREPEAQSAADVGRQQSSQPEPEPDPTPEPEPEPEKQAQEEKGNQSRFGFILLHQIVRTFWAVSIS